MPDKPRELGAQNPELKNSPVACGSFRLRCERGIWVPAGPSAPGRP